MPKLIDLSGQTFGRLTVTGRAENSAAGAARWNCDCECGNKTTTAGGNLRNGATVSCGCHSLEKRTSHGLTDTPEYNTWLGMKRRCFDPVNPAYQDYGARGIIVCDEWRDDFSQFYSDMGPRPKGTNLDRIDNDGNYSPENCRWATQREQLRNE